MLLIGAEAIRTLTNQSGFSAKVVFNENGVLFFPATQEHRDHKAEGISYEDDYRGNALAAMLSPGKMDIRFHEKFSDERVRLIVEALIKHDDLEFMRNWSFTYQGRGIRINQNPGK